MAFSTKITFLPCLPDENPVAFNDVDYGLIPLGRGYQDMRDNILNNFKYLNFREINDYYIDFISELSVNEFLKFHKNYYRNSFTDQDFHRFLTNDIHSGRYNKVIINVYEWESGY